MALGIERPYLIGNHRSQRIMVVTHYLSLAALAAVFGVLLLGLFNMMRGGSPNTSQTLMRWRVGLQFAAIIVLMTALWFRS